MWSWKAHEKTVSPCPHGLGFLIFLVHGQGNGAACSERVGCSVWKARWSCALAKVVLCQHANKPGFADFFRTLVLFLYAGSGGNSQQDHLRISRPNRLFLQIFLLLLSNTRQEWGSALRTVSARRLFQADHFHPHEGLWKSSGWHGALFGLFKTLPPLSSTGGIYSGRIVFRLPCWIKYLHGPVVGRDGSVQQCEC